MNEYVVTVGDEKKEIKIKEENIVSYNGENINYELQLISGNTYLLRLNNCLHEITALKINEEKYSIYLKGSHYEVLVRTGLQEKASKLIEKVMAEHNKSEINSPMPGMILKIKKSVGEFVEQGETVVILEAMKMENDIKSPRKGKICSIQIKEGDAVEKGYRLFDVE